MCCNHGCIIAISNAHVGRTGKERAGNRTGNGESVE